MMRFAFGAKWGRPSWGISSSLLPKRSGMSKEPRAMLPMPRPARWRKRRLFKFRCCSRISFSMGFFLCPGYRFLQVIDQFDRFHEGCRCVRIGVRLWVFAYGEGFLCVELFCLEEFQLVVVIAG